MNGTPSMALGTVSPWKCTAVDSGSRLWTRTRIRSPWRTRSSGPGIWPLKANASTTLPGETSQRTASVVSSKVFTPPATRGSRTCPPVRPVLAGNAFITASCMRSIATASIVCPDAA